MLPIPGGGGINIYYITHTFSSVFLNAFFKVAWNTAYLNGITHAELVTNNQIRQRIQTRNKNMLAIENGPTWGSEERRRDEYSNSVSLTTITKTNHREVSLIVLTSGTWHVKLHHLKYIRGLIICAFVFIHLYKQPYNVLHIKKVYTTKFSREYHCVHIANIGLNSWIMILVS